MSIMPSCIENPSNEPILLLRRWQIEFCEGNNCAAAVLSFLIYFHDVKSELLKKNRKANDIAVSHGDERTQDETLYQFHTVDEISTRILHLYGKTAIADALKFLLAKEVITVHRNPNPKYKFDKTNYFLLHPEICRKWLEAYRKSSKTSSYENEDIDNPKNGPRLTETGESIPQNQDTDTPKAVNRLAKNGEPLPENGEAITKISFLEQNNRLIDRDFLNVSSFTDSEQPTQKAEPKPDSRCEPRKGRSPKASSPR